jgi:hypothetical protein
MKVFGRGLVSIAVALLFVSSAFASTLESKKNEWAFSFSFSDVDDVVPATPADESEKETDLDVSWGWIFGKGHHQVGALATYVNVDSDVPANENDGLAIGPLYTFNWTPGKDKATGFLEAAYSTTSGDLGDVVDSIWHVGVGARVFAGDTAAIRITYFFEKAQGAGIFDDQDATGLSAGISFFTHAK